MKRLLIIAIAIFALPFSTFAQDALQTVEKEFEELSELGKVEKPTTRIDNAQEAFDFIMADKLMRKAIVDKKAEGYEDWKAVAKKLGYDGDEPIYEVRVTSSNLLPPFTCLFRFDSIGNDRRKQPWNGCKYE